MKKLRNYAIVDKIFLMRMKGERQPQMDADGEAQDVRRTQRREGETKGGQRTWIGEHRSHKEHSGGRAERGNPRNPLIRENPRSRQVAMRTGTGAWPYAISCIKK